MSYVTVSFLHSSQSYHDMGVGVHVMNLKACFHQPLLELFKGGDQR